MSTYTGSVVLGPEFIPAFNVSFCGDNTVIIGRNNALSYAEFLSKEFNKWVYVEFCGVANTKPMSVARAFEKYFKDKKCGF